MGRERGDDPAHRDDDARRDEHDAAWPTGRHAQPEQQRDGKSRGERDQPGPALWPLVDPSDL
jgi:hypothetical protein